MSHAPKHMTAFLGTLYVGTDRLDRALTAAENQELSAHLRAHDFGGASMVSLRFAFKLRRSIPAGQDLQGRANLRLVRHGWDCQDVTLVKRLCRLVWSEHTNERSETAHARRAEEVFLREQDIHGGATTPSDVDRDAELQAEVEADARNAAQIDALRAAFAEANDAVNLLWLELRLRDVTDIAQMARESGRDERELYLAQKRRMRHVTRMSAAFPRGPRVKDEEDMQCPGRRSRSSGRSSSRRSRSSKRQA